MNRPALSIIVTTMNEEGTIERCTRRIFDVLDGECEVLVIDGGSDRTGDIVRKLANEFPRLRYIHNENDRGKGHAVRIGIEAARADIMAQIDGDLQFLPEELPRLVEPIRKGCADVTLGSRFTKGSIRNPGGAPWHRAIGNRTISLYTSLLCGQRMTDVLAGMKAWTRAAAEAMQLRCDHASYDAEVPVRALSRSMRVVDVPISTDARKSGRSKVKVIPVGLKLLRDIALIRFDLM
ncbi:glycosyltransferase family 2 protein [candidate division KSB1 bacterium]|nr:glycosyltransferase family 2 protein [candidate division KSB1 bacterium]NIT71286.1 glycosyltransferase family 2 protein [candidate division KSB1 bacterium]NIU24987.1 glycosyltransferase family 2 protein [candidate division KSB1 bacterium]NIU90799.1 glycosyltransferase [candidate division KSB1 bacterium]NIV93060.1 glycosyltransferase [candidate division KSB1 bacterium]